MSVKSWHLYMIRCADDTLYTGITTNVLRRFGEHQAQGKLCARYLRGRAPLQLVFTCPAGDRRSASQLEYRLKQLSRADKLALIRGEKTLDFQDTTS